MTQPDEISKVECNHRFVTDSEHPSWACCQKCDATRHARIESPTPAEARGDSRLCTRLRREAVTWESWNNDHPDEAAVTTPPLLRQAADALDTIARQLAEAEERVEAAKADERWQMQRALQAEARLAAVEIQSERAVRIMRDTLDADNALLTAADNLEAALQPKE